MLAVCVFARSRLHAQLLAYGKGGLSRRTRNRPQRRSPQLASRGRGGGADERSRNRPRGASCRSRLHASLCDIVCLSLLQGSKCECDMELSGILVHVAHLQAEGWRVSLRPAFFLSNNSVLETHLFQ